MCSLSSGIRTELHQEAPPRVTESLFAIVVHLPNLTGWGKEKGTSYFIGRFPSSKSHAYLSSRVSFGSPRGRRLASRPRADQRWSSSRLLAIRADRRRKHSRKALLLPPPSALRSRAPANSRGTAPPDQHIEERRTRQSRGEAASATRGCGHSTTASPEHAPARPRPHRITLRCNGAPLNRVMSSLDREKRENGPARRGRWR